MKYEGSYIANWSYDQFVLKATTGGVSYIINMCMSAITQCLIEFGTSS